MKFVRLAFPADSGKNVSLMIKNILAVVGLFALVAGGAALAVFKPWEKTEIVSVATVSVPVVYFDALREDGVNVERVSIETGKNQKAVLYVSYSKLFKSPVILRAFDRNRNEIGRSKRVISGDVEEADYADFEFGARVPMKSVTFFELTKSKVEPVAAEEEAEPEMTEEETVSDVAEAEVLDEEEPAAADVPAVVEPEAVPAQ